MPRSWHSSVSHARVEAPYSGLMESTRQTWNDERMDEFAERTEDNFKEVRREIRGVRTELKDEVRDLRTEMNGRFARIERRFDLMFGAMITGFVGLIISHFLG
jgi:hypothetical protein